MSDNSWHEKFSAQLDAMANWKPGPVQPRPASMIDLNDRRTWPNAMAQIFFGSHAGKRLWQIPLDYLEALVAVPPQGMLTEEQELLRDHVRVEPESRERILALILEEEKRLLALAQAHAARIAAKAKAQATAQAQARAKQAAPQFFTTGPTRTPTPPPPNPRWSAIFALMKVPSPGKHIGKCLWEVPEDDLLAMVHKGIPSAFDKMILAHLGKSGLNPSWADDRDDDDSGLEPKEAPLDFRAIVKRWYYQMSRTYHPDYGGSTEKQTVLNDCHKALLKILEENTNGRRDPG